MIAWTLNARRETCTDSDTDQDPNGRPHIHGWAVKTTSVVNYQVLIRTIKVNFATVVRPAGHNQKITHTWNNH